MRLTARRVTDLTDVEKVRVIRNECRQFMTHDSGYITAKVQHAWWDTIDHNTTKLFLYTLVESLIPREVGYGYMHQDANDYWWLSGGLVSMHRGQGLGKELFRHLIEEVLRDTDKPCRLEVFESNIAGYKTYKQLGFREIGRRTAADNKKVIIMEHTKLEVPLFKVFMAETAEKAVGKVLRSGYIGQGEKVEEFEAELRKLFQSDRDVLTVSSCTAALDLALHLIGVTDGDEVITTAQTCTATNGVIVNRGAIPVWADISDSTGLIDPDSVKSLIMQKTKAIMAVDWGGVPCDYDKLKVFGIPVVEDAAHCLLATRHGRPLSQSGGDYVCYSFQAIKFLTTGDGGALICPHGQVDRARLLRWFGLDRRSSANFRCAQNIQEAGFKYHMNDIAATIGLENIKHMPEVIKQHRANAKYYSERFGCFRSSKITAPAYDDQADWWLYTLRVDYVEAFSKFMAANHIAVSPVHARNDRHAAFARAAALSPLNKTAKPGLDRFSAHEVAIPVGWWLAPESREYIADKVQMYATR